MQGSSSIKEQVGAVLVVDDNPLILNVIDGLLKAENYRVFCSNNGKEAIAVLEREPVDVIICDVMMPEMDGYELHSFVREKRNLSHVSFVFLTALADGENVARGTELGADDYLIKPFDPRLLLALVRGKVKRAHGINHASNEQYDEYRRRVIHKLSHEFRTPLVSINTGTELLLDESIKLEDDNAKSLLRSVQRGGKRLERLVGDFILMQQLDAGVATKLFETQAKKKKVRDLFDVYIKTRAAEATVEGFEIVVSDETDGAEIVVYEAHLLDVLQRLVANSMKFKGTYLKIEIVALWRGEEVVIEVRDRGIGFDTKKAEEAIALFGQINRERLEQQGGGFGLAITNEFVKVNRGKLSLESRENGGSIIRLTFPNALS